MIVFDDKFFEYITFCLIIQQIVYNTFMNFRRDTKGFTLGELLTVVMIIAILVGVALPVYANQIEKSREDNDISLVRAAYTEVYVASLNGNLAKTVEVKLSQSVYDWQYHDTITFDDISHSKGDGDSPNWRGVPGKNGTCVVSYDENVGIVLNWSGDKNNSGPNINYSEDLREILNKTGYLTTYSNQYVLEIDSNSGSTPMKKEIEKYMGENSLLKYGTWAFLADPKNSINSSTPYSYVFWTCVDTNKVGPGVKIPVIIAKPNGTYCISDSITAERNNKYVGKYVAIADHIGNYTKFRPYVNGKTEYTSLEEAYKEYEKYVGQKYPTYKEDLPK